MIVSTSLSSVPFLSHTDSTRLQMSAKQLKQTITSINCERPFVIGRDWNYLKESKIFKQNAKKDGQVVINECGLLFVVYEDDNIEYFEVEKYKTTYHGFCSELRFCLNEGSKFKKGDLLFEYDCFRNNIASYGYNANVAYIPFFGYNFEDAIVMSESFAKKTKHVKMFKETIPIYAYTLFKDIYKDSEWGFIPEVGQKIEENVICDIMASKKDGKNKLYKGISSSDLNSLLNEKGISKNYDSIYSKIENGIVNSIKVHHIDKKMPLIDKELEKKLKKLHKNWISNINPVYQKLINNFGKDYANELTNKNFIMQKTKEFTFNKQDLVYVLEIEIVKKSHTQIGDKFSNR